jgi:hypothetical protein
MATTLHAKLHTALRALNAVPVAKAVEPSAMAAAAVVITSAEDAGIQAVQLARQRSIDSSSVSASASSTSATSSVSASRILVNRNLIRHFDDEMGEAVGPLRARYAYMLLNKQMVPQPVMRWCFPTAVCNEASPSNFTVAMIKFCVASVAPPKVMVIGTASELQHSLAHIRLQVSLPFSLSLSSLPPVSHTHTHTHTHTLRTGRRIGVET